MAPSSGFKGLPFVRSVPDYVPLNRPLGVNCEPYPEFQQLSYTWRKEYPTHGHVRAGN
jgi:hypothetical protein